MNLVTNILRDILDINYCDNIKTWMKYCACWNHDSLIQWLMFPQSSKRNIAYIPLDPVADYIHMLN